MFQPLLTLFRAVFAVVLAVFAVVLAAFAVVLAVFAVVLAVFAVVLAVFAVVLAAFAVVLAVFAVVLAAFAVELAVFAVVLAAFAVVLAALATVLTASNCPLFTASVFSVPFATLAILFPPISTLDFPWKVIVFPSPPSRTSPRKFDLSDTVNEPLAVTLEKFGLSTVLIVMVLPLRLTLIFELLPDLMLISLFRVIFSPASPFALSKKLELFNALFIAPDTVSAVVKPAVLPETLVIPFASVEIPCVTTFILTDELLSPSVTTAVV